jgi:predicted peptidase
MRFVALSLLLLSCGPHSYFVPDEKTHFHRDADLPFVYLPKDWSADRAWPVIVYMHGGAEGGTDGVRPTQSGLGLTAWRSHGEFPFIVIFPQTQYRRSTLWGMPEPNARVLANLDAVIAKYHGDPDRVILTGNSMGGYGTWFLGALHPEKFAALVPICGGVRGDAPKGAPFAEWSGEARVKEVVRRIGKLPVWAFHGAKDWMVPVASSRELVRALKEAGGNVRYTEYPDLGHVSWDRAYAEPELLTWMLAQRRAPAN